MITSLLGTAAGATVGDTTANAVSGSLNAQSAVGNNNTARLTNGMRYVIIPAFGALYCSIDKVCHDASGVFIGILSDLIEQDRQIEAENQKELERIKNDIWISSNNSDEEKKVNTNASSTVQTATGSPQIEPPDEEQSKNKDKNEKVNNLLNNSVQKTNRNSLSQYDRNITNQNSWQQANKDFDSLNLQNIRTFQTRYGEGRIGTLPDGRIVNIRPGSSNGQITLEIRSQNSNRVIKIRY